MNQLQEIGEFLAQRRYAVGRTQRELGVDLGMSQNSVTQIEKGQVDWRLQTLERFARYFGYRIEIHFVNDETGEDLIATPDPTLRKTRTYDQEAGTKKPRKQSLSRKRERADIEPKRMKPVKQVVRNLEQADFERDMQDMRASIWGK